MTIHWLADAIWLVVAMNVFALIWGLLMWRNAPRDPSDQARDDAAQVEALSRWKRAA